MARSLFTGAALLGALVVGMFACSVDVRDVDDDDGGSGAGASGGASASFLPSDRVSINSIEMYQSLRRPLMEGGAAAASDLPLVAGREGVMRIFYTTTAPIAVDVTVRVTVGDAAPIELAASAIGTSTVDDIGSTINVTLPGEVLVAGAGYRVEVLEAADQTSGSNAAAVFPAEGQEVLPLNDVGGPIKLVIVPIVYSGDGSNRVPDTSDTQLARYREKFMAYYPVPDVEIVVHGEFGWGAQISPFGDGWGQLLDAFAQYRQQQGAAPNEHYYGIFDPSPSFGQYCQQGCILGLSYLAQSPGDSWARAGIGLGFLGTSADTGAHEIGHQHGREHAPCQTNDFDNNYPHSGGTIGVWGLDSSSMRLLSPNQPDFMGYCDPAWVSDYTYTALFNRLRAINGVNSVQFDEAELDQTYERVRIGADGAHWSKPMKLHTPPQGEITQVTITGADGPKVVTGRYYPYSHLPGGVLFYAKQTQPISKVSFDIRGLHHDLAAQ